uniref:Solute carrier family 39 member 10 n=1 Tax=Leptobrachium leishanense TaxID=445787 RepID=A0A8C5QZ88_9ANUR
MKVHSPTKLCFICLFTFIFHHCNHCHEDVDDHTSEENRIQITELSSSTSSVGEAEHEQKYYIDKLFHRYGANGRLSFNGLEKLLYSLGLGEVKVVEIVHDDIGHDHVSHLDALDVQERKHHHDHSHVDSVNDTKSPVSAKEIKKCENKNVDVFVQTTHKNAHNHSHHHGLNGTHHHNGSHHSHNGTASQAEHGRHNHETLADTNTTQDQGARKPHKHKKRQKGGKVTAPPVDPTSEFVSHDAHDDHNHVHKTDHFGSPLREHDRNNHADHESEENLMPERRRSTRKREAPHDDHVNVKNRDIKIHKEHSEDLHTHDECLNVTQLLRYYGLNSGSPISPDQFAFLCPALLYQIDSRFCIKHLADLQMENLDKSKSEYSAWICGFISITVISLLSLLGVILIPIINQGCFKYLLNFLVALAVGTLSGDALLHLLPHSQGGHDHSNEHHEHGGHEENKSFLEQYDSILKGLVALGGIYLLFIVEHCLRMFKHYKEQKGKQKWLNRKIDETAVGRNLSDHKLNRRSDAEWLQLKPISGVEDSMASEVERLNETEMTYVGTLQQSPTKEFIPAEDILDGGQYGHNHHNAEMPKKHNHNKHSHHSHGHCHSGKDMKDTGIANIAWMVIMGDGMHNFSDGLAIGAAFSAGLPGGISTSVAVFCHELPHELGDFAVLLKAGMTVNQAIVYNLLSAMMAYVGMLIGTAVGQYATNITPWVFAVTAGMFLYVALVDMLPEMLHGDGESEHCPIGHFTLQNLGLLFGFAIMLIIALYEDKLVIDIPF